MKKTFCILLLFILNLNLSAQADSVYRGTIKISKPDSSVYYYEIGKEAYLRAHYDSAIICFSRSLIFNPQKADSYCGKCASYINQNNYSEALKDCLISVKLDSLQFDAFFNIGLCYSNILEYDKAIPYYSTAIKNFKGKDNADIGEAYYERGKAYESINDEKDAKKDMKLASENKNYNAISWLDSKTKNGK